MRGSFFNRPGTVVTSLFTVNGDMKHNLDLIRRSVKAGAQGIAVQLMDMPPEMRTVKNYKNSPKKV